MGKKNLPCYECIFPRFSGSNILNCDQMGMVSPVAGFGGIMQAISVVNIIFLHQKKYFKEMIFLIVFANKFKENKSKKKL